MSKILISVSSLNTAIASGREFVATASKVPTVKGYTLELKEGRLQYVLSTWRSLDARIFKTADSLIKEAEGFGFDSIMFDLANTDNGA